MGTPHVPMSIVKLTHHQPPQARGGTAVTVQMDHAVDAEVEKIIFMKIKTKIMDDHCQGGEAVQEDPAGAGRQA